MPIWPLRTEHPRSAPTRERTGWLMVTVWVLIWLSLALTSLAQAASLVPNQILHFRGTNNFVEVPSARISKLRESTVECWVRWQRFRDHARILEFGRPFHCFTLATLGARPDLVFEISSGQGNGGSLHVPGIWWPSGWALCALEKLRRKIYRTR